MENEKKHWIKTWKGILAVIFSAIILFFISASIFYFISEIKNAQVKIKESDVKLRGQTYSASEGDHYWTGSENAKITIVEFGDFACSACVQSFRTAREISLKYKGETKFIWRDYPIMQEYSVDLALAGRCAGEQKLFWPMHDKLFQNQGVNTADQLAVLAGQIGADAAKFKDCFDNKKYLPQIQKDLSDGQSFGNSGTPTYFINGYKISGDIPYNVFVKIIEELKK